jgi:hypothetical protein
MAAFPDSSRADFLILKSGKTYRGKLEKDKEDHYSTTEASYRYAPEDVARASTEKTVEEVIKNWSRELEGKQTLEANKALLCLAKFCIYHRKVKEAYRFCCRWAGPRGWHVDVSKYFFILSNTKKKKRTAEVKIRLDAIMNKYQKEFPTEKKLKRDFVVRFFDTEEAFEEFSGKTDAGAYYDPETFELVFYDMSDVNKNFTFEAVYHEANHQYIDQYYFKHNTEHMWFSEGLATYYESAKFKKGRIVEVGKKSLDYYPRIKEALQTETYTPLTSFLSIKQAEFSNPEKSSANYAQAWSLIYFFKKTRNRVFAGMLEKYMAVLKKTRNADKARQEAFPQDRISELEAAWKKFILD